MQFKRMFSTDAYKGTSGYLRTQKNYEILRTVLYFAISLSLFIAGRVTTGQSGESSDHRSGTGMSSGMQKSGGDVYVLTL